MKREAWEAKEQTENAQNPSRKKWGFMRGSMPEQSVLTQNDNEKSLASGILRKKGRAPITSFWREARRLLQPHDEHLTEVYYRHEKVIGNKRERPQPE